MFTLTLQKACDYILNGDVVVIPTETVYGLAANIYNEKAIAKIFTLKKRPANNPLIIHIHDFAQVNRIAKDFSEIAQKLAKTFWPGPLTIVLPKQDHISDLVSAGKNTVGIRMPNHPIALSLLKLVNTPLAAPSANPSNYISPTTAADVLKIFPELQDKILDGGPCHTGLESTVVGVENNEIIIYRFGAISQDALEKASGVPVKILNNDNEKPTAPGMLSKHYSPHTQLIQATDIVQFINENHWQKVGVISFKNKYVHPKIVQKVVLAPDGHLHTAAQNLYSAMHYLDTCQLDVIITEFFPNEGVGLAINDRLQRAAR